MAAAWRCLHMAAAASQQLSLRNGCVSSSLTGLILLSHTAGIAANLAPELLRQKEEDARISQEDADMEQLMALGMGPARVGTHEEEVCCRHHNGDRPLFVWYHR